MFIYKHLFVTRKVIKREETNKNLFLKINEKALNVVDLKQSMLKEVLRIL